MTLAAAAITFSVPASAQNSNSSYFMEGALNRHMANPAFAPQQDYVAMPALGNFNIDDVMIFDCILSDVLYEIIIMFSLNESVM